MTEKFEMPTGVAVFFPGQAHEQIIDMVLKMWGKEYPNEVRGFGLHMRNKRENLNVENGMSDGGTMRTVLEMPAKLNKIFAGVYKGEDYLKDRKFIEALHREAPGFFTGKSATGGAGV